MNSEPDYIQERLRQEDEAALKRRREERTAKIIFVTIFVAIGFLAAISMYSAARSYHQHNTFVSSCIIERQTLPDPKAVCEALWRQGGGR